MDWNLHNSMVMSVSGASIMISLQNTVPTDVDPAQAMGTITQGTGINPIKTLVTS